MKKKTRTEFEELALALQNLWDEIVKVFIPICMPVVKWISRRMNDH